MFKQAFKKKNLLYLDENEKMYTPVVVIIS